MECRAGIEMQSRHDDAVSVRRPSGMIDHGVTSVDDSEDGSPTGKDLIIQLLHQGMEVLGSVLSPLRSHFTGTSCKSFVSTMNIVH
jgi:hypothetical protein